MRSSGRSAALLRRNGQGLVEYSLALALVAIVAVVGLTFLGTRTSHSLCSVGHGLGGSICGDFTVFSMTPGATLRSLAAAPDGSVWVNESATSGLGRVKIGAIPPVNEITMPSASPVAVAMGPDGWIWFTAGAGKIGRVMLDGTGAVEYGTANGMAAGAYPYRITAGPDGAMWFTDTSNSEIGRITTDAGHTITEYAATPAIPTSAGLRSITTGPDGALWFTENLANKIGRVSTDASHTFSEYSVAQGLSPGAGAFDIVSAPDGALWFSEDSTTVSSVGRITTTGVITEVPTPTTGFGTYGVTVGPDAALWFTYDLTARMGRISLDASHTVTELATPTGSAGSRAITLGTDGALWLAAKNDTVVRVQ